MIIESFIQIIVMAFIIYLFCYEFFEFTADMEGKDVSLKASFISFSIIYVWFLVASMIELPLIINWFFFLIILGIEVHLLYSLNYLVSYALSMFCIVIGLAVNIFCRSFTAIVLNLPLRFFDNTKSSIKTIPIFLGFAVMVILFYILRHYHFTEKMKTLLYNSKSLSFFAWTEVWIYIFLIIQLLAFSQLDESMGMKLWGIKASLFSIIFLIIAYTYSLRVASLHYYMNKQHDVHDSLIKGKDDINKLWDLAYTDMLTGCKNRQLLDRRLKENAGYESEITLAFVDVNGLKSINDKYGHLEGDRYLIMISKILEKHMESCNIDVFRYGGDEFVLMSNTLKESDVVKLLSEVNNILERYDQTSYKTSISYGVVHGNSVDYQSLITLADEKMYYHKLTYYKDIVRF